MDGLNAQTAAGHACLSGDEARGKGYWPMQVRETELPGVYVIQPKVFEDHRGYFLEVYSRQRYADAGIDVEFVQDNQSSSMKNTLRGLHYQARRPQAKLVTVLEG